MKIPPAYNHFFFRLLIVVLFLFLIFVKSSETSKAVTFCGISIDPSQGDENTEFWATIDCDANKDWALYWVETGQKLGEGAANTHADSFQANLGKGGSYNSGTHTIQLHCIKNLDFCKDKTATFIVTGAGGTIDSPFCPGGYANTAIGKIKCSPKSLAGAILGLAIGIAGGIALLLIIIGGYRVMASQGDPESMAAGKEMITNAIAGLLFIIFSAAILRILGVQILGLPGG